MKLLPLLAGGAVKPTSLRGVQSYTFQVGGDAKSVTVQFRDPKCPFDLEPMTAARETTYGRLPISFRPLLDKLKIQLPSLFTDGYPMVSNHWGYP